MSDIEQPFEAPGPADQGTDAVDEQAAEPDADWPSRITRTVAAQMRYWRDKRKLSAQQLSEKTKELGYQVPRSVIANLENNRRDTITAAEILILAAALDVPPVMLITAVGREESTEILPDLNFPTWRARGWILGALAPDYNTLSLAQWEQGRQAIQLYDIHRLLVREHEQIENRAKQLSEHGQLVADDPTRAPSFSRQRRILLTDTVTELAYSLDRIRTYRARIKKEGYLLPPLPPRLASLLRATEEAGRHRQRDDDDGLAEQEIEEVEREREARQLLLFDDLFRLRPPKPDDSSQEQE